MINSRDLNDLNPKVKDMCEAFIDKCKDEGIDILITSTYRDAESQNALYAQGRTKPGKVVTNAKAGQSFHNWKVAFDFVPLIHGKPNWDDAALFKKCGEIGKTCGLEWGGDWKFKDTPHLQYTAGLTLHDFQNGKTI